MVHIYCERTIWVTIIEPAEPLSVQATATSDRKKLLVLKSIQLNRFICILITCSSLLASTRIERSCENDTWRNLNVGLLDRFIGDFGDPVYFWRMKCSLLLIKQCYISLQRRLILHWLQLIWCPYWAIHLYGAIYIASQQIKKHPSEVHRIRQNWILWLSNNVGFELALGEG